jgi:hypothetical protein
MLSMTRIFKATAVAAMALAGNVRLLAASPNETPNPSASDVANTRAIISELERREFAAVLHNDMATLDALWSEGFMVNNPVNKIVGKQDVMGFMKRKSGLQYSAVQRQSEGMVVRPDMVVSMGYEEVVPVGSDKEAGKTVMRRYTNIWYRESGGWKLLARQATVISVK